MVKIPRCSSVLRSWWCSCLSIIVTLSWLTRTLEHYYTTTCDIVKMYSVEKNNLCLILDTELEFSPLWLHFTSRRTNCSTQTQVNIHLSLETYSFPLWFTVLAFKGEMTNFLPWTVMMLKLIAGCNGDRKTTPSVSIVVPISLCCHHVIVLATGTQFRGKTSNLDSRHKVNGLDCIYIGLFYSHIDHSEEPSEAS